MQGFNSDGKKFYSKLSRIKLGRFSIIPWVPALVLAIIVLLALFADQIAPHDPNKGGLYDQFIPPIWMEKGSSKYLLGTDYFGRDILSRLIHGSRISLSVGVVSISLSAMVGIMLGLISGYFGNIADMVIMRTVDALMSFPSILIAILLAVVFEPSYGNVILILTFVIWPRYARQVRGETLSIAAQEYVAYGRVAGTSTFRIMLKHIFPNVLPTILVLATLQVAQAIMMESMLSFLGVGVPPPTPSWGSMTADGRNYINTQWWLSAFPGMAILITVLSINLVGDWIRDRLDPKLRQV